MPTAKKRFIAVIRYIFARLNETSTLRGLALLAASIIGYNNPERMELIVGVTAVAVGALGAFLPELIIKPKQPKPPEQ